VSSEPESNEPNQAQKDGNEAELNQHRMPNASERAAKKRSRETNKRFYEQLLQQEVECADMTRLSSSPAPQPLTPMIPASKLRSALKSSSAQPSDEKARLALDISKATQPRRSVSFSEAASPVSGPNRQDDEVPQQLDPGTTPKTPAVNLLRSTANSPPRTQPKTGSSRASYYESLFNKISASPLPLKPAQDNTPSISKTSKTKLYGRKENRKSTGLGAPETGLNHEDQALPLPKNNTSQSTESRSTPPTKLQTPESARAIFEIKGDNIRMSARKESPKPRPQERATSDAECEGKNEPPAGAKSANGLQLEEAQSETGEESETEEKDTSRRPRNGSSSKPWGAEKLSEPPARRSVSLGTDSGAQRKIPEAKMVLTTAKGASTTTTEDSKDREDESSDSEPRSPARRVASSSESGSETRSESESEATPMLDPKKELTDVTPKATLSKQRKLAQSEPTKSKYQPDDSESETSSSGSESDSSSGVESESPEASKSKLFLESAEADDSSDESDSTELLKTKQGRSQQIKSPTTPQMPALSNHLSFSAMRQKSLNDSAKSKLPAYRNPVSNKPPGRPVSPDTDTSESEDDDSDSSEEEKKPLKEKEKPSKEKGRPPTEKQKPSKERGRPPKEKEKLTTFFEGLKNTLWT
jgi:hypothetical protein